MTDDISSDTSVGKQLSPSEEPTRQEMALPVLDPQSTLPQHLQGKSYEHDIWQRVRESPIRNTCLTRDSLAKNVETREIVRQIISAGNEREKEILLHNQARLFSQILSDVIRSAQRTLSTPLPVVPRTWIEETERPSITHAATSDSNDLSVEESKPASQSRWTRSILQNIIVSLITPKIFIFISVAFFASAAGYSQLQIKNLKDTIDTYKDAAEASRQTALELENLIDSMEKTRDEMNAQVAELDERNVVLANENRKRREELIGLKAQNKSNLIRISQLQSELKTSQKEESEKLGSVREQLRSALEKNTQLTANLTRSKDREESERSRRIVAEDQVDEYQKMTGSHSSEKEELKLRIRALILKNEKLSSSKALADLGEILFSGVKKQIGPLTEPNKEELKQYIREYEVGKRILRK